MRRLASTVLPALLTNKRDGDPVRVWMAGCSTGEEAYSLAMLLHAGEAGPARQCLTVLSDITARTQVEEALQAAHDDLEERVLERTIAHHPVESHPPQHAAGAALP